MSWRENITRISVVKHINKGYPFEVRLYDQFGPAYTCPLQKTCDEAWTLALNLQEEVKKSVLDMFVIDENLTSN